MRSSALPAIRRAWSTVISRPCANASSMIRSLTPAGVRAWIVHIEPRLVVIAWSIGTISRDRTSPTMIRSTPIRSDTGIRSAMLTSPAGRPSGAAFAVPLPGLEAHHRPVPLGRAGPAAARGSPPAARTARPAGISLISARITVVFPAPASPATMMFRPARMRRAKEVAQQRVDHLVQVAAGAGQVVQGHVEGVVLADHRVRAVADQEHRREPAAVGQLQVEGGLRGGQRAFGRAGPAGRRLEDLHQLVVAVGDRLGPLHAAAVPGDAYLVAAEDVHLLDGVVDEQRLEPAETGQLGGDLVEQQPLLAGGHRGAGAAYRVGVLGDQLHREPGPLGVLLVDAELPAALPPGEPLAQFPAQLADHLEVDSGAGWRLGRHRHHGYRHRMVLPAVGRWQRWGGRGRPRRLPAGIRRDGFKPHPAPPGGPATPTVPAGAPTGRRPAPPARGPRAATAVRCERCRPGSSTSAVRGSCGSRAITGSRERLADLALAVPAADQEQPQRLRLHPVLGEVPMDGVDRGAGAGQVRQLRPGHHQHHRRGAQQRPRRTDRVQPAAVDEHVVRRIALIEPGEEVGEALPERDDAARLRRDRGPRAAAGVRGAARPGRPAVTRTPSPGCRRAVRRRPVRRCRAVRPAHRRGSRRAPSRRPGRTRRGSAAGASSTCRPARWW